VTEAEPGADRHIWETRLADIEEELVTDRLYPLPELLDLTLEVLAAAGYVIGEQTAQASPDVDAVVARAEEIVAALDRGDAVRDDDAQQAAAELRALVRELIESPQTDAGADLRVHRRPGGG
jgi:hypothetical protein